MTEESLSPTRETVFRDEVMALQEQLKIAKTERVREAFEKAEMAYKAQGIARERDELRDNLASMTVERDHLAFEKAAEADRAESAERREKEANSQLADAEAEVARLQKVLIDEKAEMAARIHSLAVDNGELHNSLATMATERDRLAAEKTAETDRVASAERREGEANRRFVETEAKVAFLQQALADASSMGLIKMLCSLVHDRTRSIVARTRAQIPDDSPILHYFDKLVTAASTVRSQTMRLSIEVYDRARPQVMDVLERARKELQGRFLAK